MIVISRFKIKNGERHVTREVTLSARKSIRPKNNFRGITMGIGPIWGITSLTLILSCNILIRLINENLLSLKLHLSSAVIFFKNYYKIRQYVIAILHDGSAYYKTP